MSENVIEFLIENDFSLEGIEKIPAPVLTFKSDEYNLCIDSNIANCLIQYQDTVYRTYCLGKYGSKNINKLTPEEKKQLTLNFKIKEGSTEYIAKIEGFMKMILEHLPEEQRVWAILILSCTFVTGLGSYLFYRYKSSRLAQSTLIGEQENVRLAIQKLAEIAESNSMATQAVVEAMKNEKKIVNSMEKTETPFTINGKKYPKKEIENISKDYSQKEEPSVKAYIVEGDFKVTAITVEKPFKITFENSDKGKFNADYDPKFFSREVLNAARQGLENATPVYFKIKLNVVERDSEKEVLLFFMSESK